MAYTVHTVACADCGSVFTWALRGAPPVRCKVCAAGRKRVATRDRARRRRAENPRGPRYATCSTCTLEFIASDRGKVPARCPSCAQDWSRNRHRNTVRRAETSRDYMLRSKYGLGIEDWENLYSNQGGCCAICRRSEDEVGRLHVDHDHDSGAVRGLLCRACNTSIGHFREDPEVIRSAAAYIESHRAAQMGAY